MTMADDPWLRELQADDTLDRGSIAGRVTNALPRRRRTGASIAALIGGGIAAAAAAGLAPAYAVAIGDVIAGEASARIDGLVLLAVPILAVLVLRAPLERD
jgi:hypothetical protein